MIEKALSGNKHYWTWIGILIFFICVGFFMFLHQLDVGLAMTGLSRDVPWGFYIAQFTFLVGVAASAVMVVLPYYLHDYKAFGKMTIIGEFVAISAVLMCLLFILVDMGGTHRIFNAVLHPTPNSLIFWDMVVLNGYLILNVVISRTTFLCHQKEVEPPKWLKPVVYLSIPWAVSIHTVTAFLYSGLSARAFWMTAILAPRFLASAFATGPALLILIALILKRVANYDVGEKAINKLGEIVTYAMLINLFFVALELFTGLYSHIPEHMHHFEYLYLGIGENTFLVPWMWTSVALSILSVILLVIPSMRRNIKFLVVACVAVIGSLWIDKGMGLVITGFVPNPFGKVTEYSPTFEEVFLSIGIYAIGLLVLTGLYKIYLSYRDEGHVH